MSTCPDKVGCNCVEVGAIEKIILQNGECNMEYKVYNSSICLLLKYNTTLFDNFYCNLSKNFETLFCVINHISLLFNYDNSNGN